MFNRSIKYLILLCINIIVLVVYYVNQTPSEEGIFDTQFVINLLEERDELQEELIDIQIQMRDNQRQVNIVEGVLEETQRLLTDSTENLRQCEVARLDAIALANEQAAQLDARVNTYANNNAASASNCNAQSAKLRVARQELASATAQLDTLRAEKKELESLVEQTSDSPDTEQLIDEIEKLKAENAQLKSDIENPIYLKSVYISGRKCEKPDFDELVCLKEIMVRPKFSKAPTTNVMVRVYSPDDRLIARSSFSSDRAQLYRFELGRGRELLAGEYYATFEVEDELLNSGPHLIKQ
uniref:hypothetical protein n=1 Tax=Ningiella ruwaisensis TaxID=2364274 RepID=UPI00109F6396|nr:hypothetical protein [Ningiella ruwaisensis]